MECGHREYVVIVDVLALFNFSVGLSYCIAATASENIQTKAALEKTLAETDI